MFPLTSCNCDAPISVSSSVSRSKVILWKFGTVQHLISLESWTQSCFVKHKADILWKRNSEEGVFKTSLFLKHVILYSTDASKKAALSGYNQINEHTEPAKTERLEQLISWIRRSRLTADLFLEPTQSDTFTRETHVLEPTNPDRTRYLENFINICL